MSAIVVDRLRARGLLEHVERKASEYHVTVEEICGVGRSKTVSAARQATWCRLRVEGLSLPEIGALFDRNHTTVLHGIRSARVRATTSIALKRVAS